MKRHKIYCALAGIITLIVSIGENLQAQAVWVPNSVNIKVPVVVSYHKTQTGTFGSYDRYDTSTFFLGLAQDEIRFIIDTVSKQVNDFFIQTYTDTSYHELAFQRYRHLYSIVQFSKLNYRQLSRDTIQVNVEGGSCKQSIDTMFFYSHSTDDYNWRTDNAYNTSEGQSLYLLDDTGSYICSFTLIRMDQNNEIKNIIEPVEQILKVYISLPDCNIHFSFPSLNQQQPIIISDILGREVWRTEILFAEKQYNINSRQLTKGYYSARLGNLRGSFVVH